MSAFRVRDARVFAETMRKRAFHSICIVAILFGLAPLDNASTAFAQQSTSAARNLRVTGVTDWTVSLAWDAPKKAAATYVIQSSTGFSMTVAGSQTTAIFSGGFNYTRTYSFRVFAVTSSNVWSGASNTVTATLLSDTTPAATPVVSSTAIGPTHVDLTWSYADNDPSPRFDIFINGQLTHGQVAGTAMRMVFLRPATTYTFTMKARDSAGNSSDVSDPHVVTTPAADPNDHDPPTMPPGLWGGVIDDAIEAMVFWGNSTDNVTAQEHIAYQLSLNGVVDNATIYPYRRQFSMYLTGGGVNTIEVYALDEAGNRSTAATMTIDLRPQ
jgi:chitodextrinase